VFAHGSVAPLTFEENMTPQNRNDFLKVLWIVLVAVLLLAIYRQWEIRNPARGGNDIADGPKGR
jgi:hypothetical protein